MPGQISIKDIAEAAGVSHSTVSRALHGRGRVRNSTRARILVLAEEMGYFPDASARSLVVGQTNTIGVVVTTIADPFIAQIVNGIEDAAHDNGYSVFLSSSKLDAQREMAVVCTFRQRRVDAVIVTSSRVGKLYGDDLAQFDVPIVLINSQHESQYLHAVASDDVQGIRLAAEHLVELGHQRIGFIGSAIRPPSSRRRRLGHEATLAQHGLPLDPALVTAPHAATDLEVGQQGLATLLPAGPTAIISYNDMIAVGVMLAARNRGIRIPTDLSLVGFDDIETASFVAPTLTTVRQPKADLGRAAVNMALALLDGQAVEDTRLPCELVVRESTAHRRG